MCLFSYLISMLIWKLMIINVIHNDSATLGKVSAQDWLCIIYVKIETMHTADHVKYEAVQIDRT